MTETSSAPAQVPSSATTNDSASELPPIAPPYCSEDDAPAAPAWQHLPRAVQTSGGWDPDEIL